jgi:hypothetical protein
MTRLWKLRKSRSVDRSRYVWNFVERPFLAAFFLLLVFASCTKQDNGTGIGLFRRDNNLSVNFSDTFQLNVASIRQDEIQTSGFEDLIIGSLNDPYFGNVQYDAYMQFSVKNSGVFFPDSAVFDSIVLYMKLGNNRGELFYGYNPLEFTFEVQKIIPGAVFENGTSYFNTSTMPTFSESLLDVDFNATFIPDFNDTVQVGLDTNNRYPGVLSLKLDDAFGEEIMGYSGTEILSTSSEFVKFFKGVKVTATPQNENGTLLYFDYVSGATAVVLYYHVGEVAKSEEFQLVNTSVAHFNSITHDYENTASTHLRQLLLDSTKSQNEFVVQAGGGFYARIQFPHLNRIKDSLNLIPINKAELILPLAESDQFILEPPTLVQAYRLDDDGDRTSLVDDLLGNLGGFYNDQTDEYRFIVTRHIQSYLNDELDSPEIYLQPLYPRTSANRAVFRGPDADTNGGLKNTRLVIYYSTLEN